MRQICGSLPNTKVGGAKRHIMRTDQPPTAVLVALSIGPTESKLYIAEGDAPQSSGSSNGQRGELLHSCLPLPRFNYTSVRSTVSACVTRGTRRHLKTKKNCCHGGNMATIQPDLLAWPPLSGVWCRRGIRSSAPPENKERGTINCDTSTLTLCTPFCSGPEASEA
jgi:hypothetical protein